MDQKQVENANDILKKIKYITERQVIWDHVSKDNIKYGSWLSNISFDLIKKTVKDKIMQELNDAKKELALITTEENLKKANKLISEIDDLLRIKSVYSQLKKKAKDKNEFNIYLDTYFYKNIKSLQEDKNLGTNYSAPEFGTFETNIEVVNIILVDIETQLENLEKILSSL